MLLKELISVWQFFDRDRVTEKVRRDFFPCSESSKDDSVHFRQAWSPRGNFEKLIGKVCGIIEAGVFNKQCQDLLRPRKLTVDFRFFQGAKDLESVAIFDFVKKELIQFGPFLPAWILENCRIKNIFIFCVLQRSENFIEIRKPSRA